MINLGYNITIPRVKYDICEMAKTDNMFINRLLLALIPKTELCNMCFFTGKCKPGDKDRVLFPQEIESAMYSKFA